MNRNGLQTKRTPADEADYFGHLAKIALWFYISTGNEAELRAAYSQGALMNAYKALCEKWRLQAKRICEGQPERAYWPGTRKRAIAANVLEDVADELEEAIALSTKSAADALSRVQDYLGNGGFFNPEMMDHEKVRTLIMDLAAVVQKANKPALGIPSHICGICYHQFDTCSHCYDSGLEVCEVCGKPQQNGVWICDGCNPRATQPVTQHLQGPATSSCRWCNGSGEDVEVDDNGNACTREMCQYCRGTGKVG